MSHIEALSLLDAARRGDDIPRHIINAALCATGDITEDDATGYPVVETRQAGTWERKATGLSPAQWFEVIA